MIVQMGFAHFNIGNSFMSARGANLSLVISYRAASLRASSARCRDNHGGAARKGSRSAASKF